MPAMQGRWATAVLRACLPAWLLLLFLGFGVSVLAAWLPGAGSLALVSDRNGGWRIFLYDLGTARIAALTRQAGDELAPAWSPDGARLAFHADRDGDGRAELYTVDATGRNLREVAVQAGHNWRPVWSPDAQSLVFIRGFGNLYLLDLATGSERALGEGFGPAWSPDGRFLVVYLDPDGRLSADLFLIEMARGISMNVTVSSANEWSPAWSPDGRMMAYSSPRDSTHAEIYLLDTACLEAPNLATACRGMTRRLTTNNVNEFAASWSPDSSALAVVVEQDGRTVVRQIDAQTGESRLLVGGHFNYHSPAWRP